MKTKREIFQDVIALVKKQGGRAVDCMDYCTYVTEDGKICGHSMALKEELRGKVGNNPANYVIDELELGDKCHQEQYQGHSPEFWLTVQQFHDGSNFWNGIEVNEKGLQFIENNC